MKGITDSTIAQTCPDLLDAFITKTCAVSTNDSKHSFPYGCRAYAPGEQRYAVKPMCNLATINPFDTSSTSVGSQVSIETINNTYKVTPVVNELSLVLRYSYCNFNYYLYNSDACNESNKWCYDSTNATKCQACPTGYVCMGGTSDPTTGDQTKIYEICGSSYIGSMYHKLVRYALQNCVRPSNNSGELSETLLGDVDNAMKKVKQKLATELSTECSDMGGTWVEFPWKDTNSDGRYDSDTSYTLHEKFYTTTGASNLWGFCAAQ